MDGGGVGRRRMEPIEGELNKLRAEQDELDGRIRLLESQLEMGPAGVDSAAARKGVVDGSCDGSVACRSRGGNGFVPDCGLPADMIYRYSRHLLLPDFGVEGQLFRFRSFRLRPSISVVSWLPQELPPSASDVLSQFTKSYAQFNQWRIVLLKKMCIVVSSLELIL
jgi:hypothetical protein